MENYTKRLFYFEKNSSIEPIFNKKLKANTKELSGDFVINYVNEHTNDVSRIRSEK